VPDAGRRYEQLKREVERDRERQQRLEGARDELLRRLKDEHGCKGVKEAQRKRDRLLKEAEALEEQAETALDQLEKLREP
jgi:DNA repair exonuclease SbcCD ATPase subunit